MTYQFSDFQLDPVPNRYFALPGDAAKAAQAQGNTVTVDRLTATLGDGGYGALRGFLWRGMLVPTSVDPVTKQVRFARNKLSVYDSFPDQRYKGADVHVYRVVNQRMTFVGSTKVTSSMNKIVDSMEGGGKTLPPGVQSWTTSREGYNKKGMVKHYKVAAVGADGKRGPLSAGVTFTFGTSGTGATERTSTYDPLVANFDSVDTALPVPTEVTATGSNANDTVTISFQGDQTKHHAVYSSYHPEVEWDEYLVVEDASILAPGDLLVMSKRFDHTVPKAEAISPRVWSAGQVTYRYGAFGMNFNEDLSPAGRAFEFREENGVPFMRVTIPAGYTQRFEDYTHSGPTNGYYNVFQPGEVISVHGRMRAVNTPISNMRPYMGRMGAGEGPFTLGTAWETLKKDFTIPEPVIPDKIPQSSGFDVPGPAVIDVQWMNVTRAAQDPSQAPQQVEDLLVAGKPEWVRHHALIKTAHATYAMADILQKIGPRHQGGDSLMQLFETVRNVKTRVPAGFPESKPWPQIEYLMSPAEMRMAAGALCTVYNPNAPQDDYQIGAKLRVDAGQVQPWQDVFAGLLIEGGNENWNPLSGFVTLPSVNGFSGGAVNGMLLDFLAEIIMAAPGYNPAKFSFYLGGWAINDGWNRDSILFSRHADYIGNADYNGGWDSGLTAALQADDPKAVFDTLANSHIMTFGRNRKTAAQRLVAMCNELSVNRAKPIRPMQYEAGPGYNMNGLNGASVTAEQAASQELLMKSNAAGTATLDAFLLMQSQGVVSSNFFMVKPGTYWTAASKPEKGGKANPPYMWTCFANEHLVGDVKKLNAEVAASLVSPANVKLGDQAQVYQVLRKKDGKLAYAIVNTDPVNPATIKLLVPPTNQWVRHALTGDMKATNTEVATKDAISWIEEVQPAGWGRTEMVVTIPPGMTEVFIQAAA